MSRGELFLPRRICAGTRGNRQSNGILVPERLAALERAAAPQSEPKPDNSLETLTRALSQTPLVPDALRHELQGIVIETVHRLRNLLHQGKLTTYYFGDNGCRSVSLEFWATAHADGVIKSGTYWPFGKPTRWYERRPNFSLFLLQSELDALLSEQPAKKRPLPAAKMPELVAALRQLDELPNRAAQREALCKMQNSESTTSRTAIFERRQGRPGHAAPAANRGRNRDGIRDVKLRHRNSQHFRADAARLRMCRRTFAWRRRNVLKTFSGRSRPIVQCARRILNHQ